MNAILIGLVIFWIGRFLYQNFDDVIRGLKYTAKLPLFTKLHIGLAIAVLYSFYVALNMSNRIYPMGYSFSKYTVIILFLAMSVWQFIRYHKIGFSNVIKHKHGVWVLLSYLFISVPPILDTIVKNYPQLPYYSFSFLGLGICLLFTHEAEMQKGKYY